MSSAQPQFKLSALRRRNDLVCRIDRWGFVKGIRNGAEKRIYLNMDARSKYGDTIAVLNQIQLAGIKNVSFPYPQVPE
jgi:biopolymer transport protein ExbD